MITNDPEFSSSDKTAPSPATEAANAPTNAPATVLATSIGSATTEKPKKSWAILNQELTEPPMSMKCRFIESEVETQRLQRLTIREQESYRAHIAVV